MRAKAVMGQSMGGGGSLSASRTRPALPAAVTAADLPTPAAVQDMVPTEDDWNEWAPQGEDAIASLVYLLELIGSDDVAMAAYAAQRAYAAVDELEAREQELGVLDAEAGEALLRSSSIQIELQRQADALRMLRDPAAGSSAISELRVAARRSPIGGVPESE